MVCALVLAAAYLLIAVEGLLGKTIGIRTQHRRCGDEDWGG